MDGNKKSFEGRLKQIINGHVVEPSPHVISNIKRKLLISEFLSLNIKKFNIAYATIIIATIAAVPFITDTKEDDNLKSTIISEDKHGTSQSEIKNEVGLSEEKEIKEIQEDVASAGTTEELVQRVEEVFEAPEKIVNTYNASYTANKLKGCVPLEVSFNNTSINLEKFRWDFGTGEKSTSKSPYYTFKAPGVYKVELIAYSSAGEKYSYIKTVEVYDKPMSSFEIDIENSNSDIKQVSFKNTSKKAESYKWIFDDQQFSDLKEPKHIYKDFGIYDIGLVAISDKGCSDTVYRKSKFIEKDYKLIFPQKFKPNLRGANNGVYERPENAAWVFYPRNFGVKEYKLTIQSSNGVEVFSTTNIKQGWDGYIKGRLAPAGVYTYNSEGVYPNGKTFSITGSVRVVIDNSYQNYYNH